MQIKKRERGEGVLPQMLVRHDGPFPELMEEGEEGDAPASHVEWNETTAPDSGEGGRIDVDDAPRAGG